MKKEIKEQLYKNITFSVIGMIGLSAYILADTFFIAQGIGILGMSALNIVLPMFSLIIATGLMLGMGGATLFTLHSNDKNRNTSNMYFTHTILLASLISLIFIIASLFFSSQIVIFLGSNDEIQYYAQSYIKIIMFFAPLFIFNNIILSFTRNDNATKLCMQAMLIGSVLNIILDYIFIFPLNMGMQGAALATIVSPLVSLIILSKHFITKQNTFKLIKCKINVKKCIKIITFGASSFITELSTGIMIIFFNILILAYAGTIGIAAFGIMTNIYFILIAIYTGINQGLQPLASYYYSIKDLKTCHALFKKTQLIAVISSVVFYLLIYVNAYDIIHLFNPDSNEQLDKIAQEGIKLYFLAAIFISQNIVISGYLTAIKHAKQGVLISALRGFIITIPVLFLMAYLFQLKGIFLSLLVSEFIIFIIANQFVRIDESQLNLNP